MAKPSVGVERDDTIIPIVDFSEFLHGSASAKLSSAQSIVHAFVTSGFVYLRNHDVSPAMLHEVFAQSVDFFKRPQGQKDSLAWTTPESNRGYVATGREKVTQSHDPEEVSKLRASIPDLKESVEIGKEGVMGMPNQWPDKMDDEGQIFKETMKLFFSGCSRLHATVMRAIALGMGLDEHFFDSYTDEDDNTLRLLHYPPAPKSLFKDNPDQVRAGEHSDYGSITLLFQDNIGGLEVRSPKGTFVPVKPIEGTIVVNAGDLLSRWSNDRIKSTHHRVVQPLSQERDESDIYPSRYSIAYFCNPNSDSWIEALPGTWENSPEGKKYPGVRSGDYLLKRLAATY